MNKMSTDREQGRGNKRARVTRGSRNPKHGKREALHCAQSQQMKLRKLLGNVENATRGGDKRRHSRRWRKHGDAFGPWRGWRAPWHEKASQPRKKRPPHRLRRRTNRARRCSRGQHGQRERPFGATRPTTCPHAFLLRRLPAWSAPSRKPWRGRREYQIP
jgi:hypothetical protein